MELKKLNIKYLDLFSGIGGFTLGIGNKAECIGYSEKPTIVLLSWV